MEVKDYTSRHTKTWKRWLTEYIGRSDIRMLEIGGYAGQSSAWFCDEILTGENSRLDVVDVWEGHVSVSSSSLLESMFDDRALCRPITKLKGRSEEILPRLKTKGARYNIIYVDGGHFAEHCLFDLVVGWSMLSPGGIMIADDYDWTHRYCPIPARVAVDAWLSVFRLSITGYEVSKTSQISLWKKKGK